MLRRGIPLMDVEAIPGVPLVVFAHNPITEDFSQDGRCGDGTRKPIAVNHGSMGDAEISPQVPIDQQKIRWGMQLVHGPPPSQPRRAEHVQRVDFSLGRDANPPSRG